MFANCCSTLVHGKKRPYRRAIGERPFVDKDPTVIQPLDAQIRF